MLSIQWCLALGASFKPLGDYLQITPMERYKWSVAARTQLREQLGLLKVALLTSKRLAIHSTPFIISDRARSIKGLTGRWEFVEIFSRISTIADLAPAVAELQSILALPAVTTAEAGWENLLGELSGLMSDIPQEKTVIPPPEFEGCAPLLYAFKKLRAGVSPQDLLFKATGTSSDDLAYRKFDLSSLMTIWFFGTGAKTFAPIVDTDSSKVFSKLLRQYDRPATQLTPATAALLVAHMYILRALPGIDQQPLDRVLEWRQLLEPSLDQFQQHIGNYIQAATTIDDRNDTLAYLKSIGPTLDADYINLERQARSAKIWPTTLGQWPALAGAGAGLVYGLASSGSFHPLIDLAAVASTSLTQGLILACTALQKSRSLQTHPLFWRFSIERQVS